MGLTQFTVRSMIAILLGLGITACAGGSGSDALERSLEADPLLAENEVAEAVPVEPEPTADAPDETVGLGLGQQLGETEQPAPLGNYTDLAEAPEELQPYLNDLVALELLPLTESDSAENGDSGSADQTQFAPNQPITRREYARWLLTVNNRLYQDAADKRIRRGMAGRDAAFQDVPPEDPDFGAIQGLAEAGLIPSALAGNATAVNFRPEDPLTREDLLLWKVPLDTREGLPTATAEAVEQAWGFQDAGRIEPLALRAVLADHQAGEFANLRRAFGFTTLFQPDRAVTRAEAAAVLWRFGSQTNGRSAADLRSADDSETEPDSDPEAGSDSEARSHPLIDQLRGNP